MTFQTVAGTVYIIGAGPGAPDLIAVRAREIIEQSDLILYADSLVEHSVADLATKSTARIVPSSGLHLQQMVEMMVEAAQAGQVVARVHSGDPALYGATHEQMALLDDAKVPYAIVPGITAAFAAAAQLGVELTIPDVVQTIILTRTAGRTTMPSGEALKTLAAPGASLAIYLSIARVKRVVEDLIASGGYTPETPVAVFHKVTWPDESHVVGTLATIAKQVRKAGYSKHALILVSPALDPELKGKKRRTSSHLYDQTYTHRFRKAESFERGKEKQEREANLAAAVDVQLGDKHLGAQRSGTVVIGITKNGTALAQSLAHQLDATASVPSKFASNGADVYANSVLGEIRRRWALHESLVLVMPTGVATRAIAPLLRGKTSDPAVVVVDEGG
ncbi:MAG: precorrin-4 C(11)-methyltransferase, partial [Candidatus Promineifilaceae bacterium]